MTQSLGNAPYDEEQFRRRLDELSVPSRRSTDRTKRISKYLRFYIEQGIYAFTRQQWQNALGLTTDTATDDCFFMLKKGLVESSKSGKTVTYTLACSRNVISQSADAIDAYASLRGTLAELNQSGTGREKRIAMTIIQLLDSGKFEFTFADWATCTGLSDSVNHEDLRNAVNHDLISPIQNGYQICKETDPDRRYSTLTPMVRDALNVLLDSYIGKVFTASEASARLGAKMTTTAYCLEQLYQKSILHLDSKNGNTYRYTFSEDYLRSQKKQYAIVQTGNAVSVDYRSGLVASARSSSAMLL